MCEYTEHEPRKISKIKVLRKGKVMSLVLFAKVYERLLLVSGDADLQYNLKNFKGFPRVYNVYEGRLKQ